MSSSTHPVTLVFVPGLMCDHATFDPLRPYLQWQGPVAVADHGDADSLPAMAQALLERTDAWELRPAHEVEYLAHRRVRMNDEYAAAHAAI